MKISSAMMDLYFGYNMRVGDVQGAHEGIEQFSQIAQNADSSEQRERYAKAAEKLQTEILPMLEKDITQLGQQLGVPQSQLGRIINIET